jgi:hypothetical protein
VKPVVNTFFMIKVETGAFQSNRRFVIFVYTYGTFRFFFVVHGTIIINTIIRVAITNERYRHLIIISK